MAVLVCNFIHGLELGESSVKLVHTTSDICPIIELRCGGWRCCCLPARRHVAQSLNELGGDYSALCLSCGALPLVSRPLHMTRRLLKWLCWAWQPTGLGDDCDPVGRSMNGTQHLWRGPGVFRISAGTFCVLLIPDLSSLH